MNRSSFPAAPTGAIPHLRELREANIEKNSSTLFTGDSRVGEPGTMGNGAWFSPRRTGHADFQHPALAVTVAADLSQAVTRDSQVNQSETVELLVVSHPFRWPEGPLTAPPEMLRQA